MKNVNEPSPMNFNPELSAEPPLLSPLEFPFVPVGGGVVFVPVDCDGGGVDLEPVLVGTVPPMVLTGVHCELGGAGCGGGVAP